MTVGREEEHSGGEAMRKREGKKHEEWGKREGMVIH